MNAFVLASIFVLVIIFTLSFLICQGLIMKTPGDGEHKAEEYHLFGFWSLVLLCVCSGGIGAFLSASW